MEGLACTVSQILIRAHFTAPLPLATTQIVIFHILNKTSNFWGNGAIKCTLIRICALVQPLSGDIMYNRRSIKE